MGESSFFKRIEIFLGVILIAFLFTYIFVLAHNALFDLDIWLHLKTGELISQNKFVPSHDIFSYTLQGKRWVNHEWLFQLIAYLVYTAWQADGLIFLECTIIVLSFLVLFFMGRKLQKSYIEIAALLFLAANVASGRFNIRPEIFSLFFFAIYLYLLLFCVEKPIAYLLLFVQFLWVNLHGYFFLGPFLIFLFILAEFIRRAASHLPWQWREESAISDIAYRRLKQLFLLSMLVCLLNPNGLKGAMYPFYVLREVIIGKTAIFFKHIEELRPTLERINLSLGNPYILMLILCLGCMALNLKRLKLIELFLFAIFFTLSLTHRNVAYFSFIGYILILSYIAPATNTISRRITIPVAATRKNIYSKYLMHSLIILFIIWLGYRINAIINRLYYDLDTNERKSLLLDIDHRRYPKEAVEFILQNEIVPQLFNDFNCGAYLIGRAYPKIKVFIDGRTEVYGPGFFKNYKEILEGNQYKFEKLIKQYDINAILLTANIYPEKIIQYIYKNPKWKLVFFDAHGIVFLKDILPNHKIIGKYKIDFNKYSVPAADLKNIGLRITYPRPYINRAYFLNTAGEYGLAIRESKEALRLLPDCVTAYYLLGKSYLNKKMYNEALENLRAALILAPRHTEALMDLGICLLELKETNFAIRAFKEAARLDKRNALAHYYLGKAYLIKHDQIEAVGELYKATKYAPDVARYHAGLGEALYKKAKKAKDPLMLAKAKEEFKRAYNLFYENR